MPKRKCGSHNRAPGEKFESDGAAFVISILTQFAT